MTWMIWGVSQWLRKPRSHDNLAKKILLTSIHTLLDYEPANKSRPWTPIPLKLAKFREPHGCQRTKHCKQLQTSKIPLVTSPYLAISLRWSVVQGPVTRHVGDLSAIHNHDFFTSGFSFQSQQRWKANFFSGLGMVNVPKNWGILNTSHQISYCVAYRFEVAAPTGHPQTILSAEVNELAFDWLRLRQETPVRYLPDTPTVCCLEMEPIIQARIAKK